MRRQRHPNTYDKPDIEGPSLYTKEVSKDEWAWVPAGMASEYPANGGLAVKHGRAEVAVSTFRAAKKRTEGGSACKISARTGRPG
mgnify:CR=1 FL=1